MNNRCQNIYRIISVFFVTILMFLLITLWWEYCFFCRQVQELEIAKQQYYFCIDELHKKLGYEKKSDAVESEQQEMQDVDIEGIIVVDESSSDEDGNDEDIVQDEEYASA